MFGNFRFRARLKQDITLWEQEGIISEHQADQLRERYGLAAVDPASLQSRFPFIVLFFAITLIAVGLFFFYEANWAKMTVTSKLVQIFGLMLVLTLGALYRIHIIGSLDTIGRTLLVLQVVSFGVAQGLIAQIYHIAAEPAVGMFVWSLFGLLTALLFWEKWLFIFSVLLFTIWNIWMQTGDIPDPNYYYLPILVLFGYVFNRQKSNVGMIVTFLSGWLWLFGVFDFQLIPVSDDLHKQTLAVLFWFVQLPLSTALLSIADKNKDKPVFFWAGVVLFALPVVVLSFTIRPFYQFGELEDPNKILMAIVALLTGLGFAGYRLHRDGFQTDGFWHTVRSQGYLLPVVLFVAGIALSGLGLATAVSVFHVMLVVLLVYITGGIERSRSVAAAELLLLGILILKTLSLFVMAMAFHENQLLYLCGSVIFVNLVYLISRYSMQDSDGLRLLDRQGTEITCAILVFLLIYALGFPMDSQKSIFEAAPEALYLLVVFFFLSVALYLKVLTPGPQLMPALLSFVIFITTLLAMGVAHAVHPTMLSILYILLSIGLCLAYLFYSLRIASKAFANLAIAGFLVVITSRFLIFIPDMLGGGLMLIFTGLVILALALVLEKNRRRLLERIAQNEGEVSHDA